MCNGRIGNANVLDFESHWLTTNERDIILPVTVMWDYSNSITDETHQQNSSQWCCMRHRCSGQSTMRSWMNDDCHAAYHHASNRINLCTGLVHMVEMWKIASGRSWKLRGMCWMRKGEEVGLNISKTSIQICIGLIAGRKPSIMIGQRHLSLR